MRLKIINYSTKALYHLIRLLRGKRAALDYATLMQIRSMKRKNERMFGYWHNKIMNWDAKYKIENWINKLKFKS